MSFIPTIVKSTQQGTITTAANSTTGTATITAVNTTKVQLTVLGQTIGSANTTEGDLARLTLTNSTTLTVVRVTNTANFPTINYRLVEFY